MAKPFYTPVRRNHIVGPAGVGSVLLTRSGVTALMCGLPVWLDKAPARGSEEAEKRTDRVNLLRSLELHDSAAEATLGVSRFINPPVVDDSPRHGVTWLLPAIRFPLAEYCRNSQCQRLGFASSESPSVTKCPDCEGKQWNRRQQVPIVRICPSGHLDEVDFFGLIHGDNPCSDQVRLKYRAGDNVTSPEITCLDCGVKRRVDAKEPGPCSGARPWLPNSPPDICDKQMTISDRSSTSVYFPDVRSYIHIPAVGGLRDTVLRWLEQDQSAHPLLEVAGDAGLDPLLKLARPYFPDLTTESLRAHVLHIREPAPLGENSAEELKALTSEVRSQPTSDGPPVLDVETIPATAFRQLLIGQGKPISRIVAVHRLAETRALVGFSRVTPPSRTEADARGFQLLWGQPQGAKAEQDWLPGMRVYGEGILLELDSLRVSTWAHHARLHMDPVMLNGERLSVEFQLAHTLAHLLMNAAATQCGYPIASLHDRVYHVDGRTALLVYTGGGDVMGTMGGLVELAQPGLLEPLLETAIANGRWCGLDPVCLNPMQHIQADVAGACHQCCLLPETSCGWWNSGLDRATLIGRGELVGYLDLQPDESH